MLLYYTINKWVKANCGKHTLGEIFKLIENYNSFEANGKYGGNNPFYYVYKQNKILKKINPNEIIFTEWEGEKLLKEINTIEMFQRLKSLVKRIKVSEILLKNAIYSK
jgi:uncharacterized lipoprotein YehR (DUF1307 family)